MCTESFLRFFILRIYIFNTQSCVEEQKENGKKEKRGKKGKKKRRRGKERRGKMKRKTGKRKIGKSKNSMLRVTFQNDSPQTEKEIC